MSDATDDDPDDFNLGLISAAARLGRRYHAEGRYLNDPENWRAFKADLNAAVFGDGADDLIGKYLTDDAEGRARLAFLLQSSDVPIAAASLGPEGAG